VASPPVWSKNSSNLAASEKFKYFNADELIEGTPHLEIAGWQHCRRAASSILTKNGKNQLT